MKKILKGSYLDEEGKRNKVICTITNEQNYISIIAEIIPYQCHTSYIRGCMEKQIIKAFPMLQPYVYLDHLNSDGTKPSWVIEDTLMLLANGEMDEAQKILNCTDFEIQELDALVRYGLYKEKSYCWHGKCLRVTGQGVDVYKNAVQSLGLQKRNKMAYNDFIKFCETL